MGAASKVYVSVDNPNENEMRAMVGQQVRIVVDDRDEPLEGTLVIFDERNAFALEWKDGKVTQHFGGHISKVRSIEPI